YFNGQFFNLNNTPVNHAFSSAHWNLELTVNKSDTNIIYLGMTEISRSINGGKTFEKIGSYNGHNIHADVRAIYLEKSTAGGKGDVFLVANDGGISLLDPLMQPAWKSLNGIGLNANQFWGIDVAQSDTLLIAGGTQDNGGFMITSDGNENTMGSCGDGYLGLVLDKHSAIIECNPPSLFYHNNQTHQNIYLQVNDARRETRRPLAQKDSFVYVGYGDVWRIKKQSLQNGSAVFQNFTNFAIQKDADGTVKNNIIRCLSIGEKNSALISYSNPNWAAKENTGKLFFCQNIQHKNSQWTDLTPLLNDKGFEVCRWSEITALEVDIYDPLKFYLLSRDVSDQTTVLLYRVEYFPDSNKCSIQKINSNLPAIGINKIRTDKYSGITYLAGDDGVYYSNLNADSVIWKKLNTEAFKLPSVMVMDLAINYVNNTLVAGTYGRGIWQTCLVSSLLIQKYIGYNTTENDAVKVDGKLSVGRKKIYSLNSKLIVTKGSSIELKKGSTLIIKKEMVRDENNKLIDLDLIMQKNRGAKVIYR
ncbi:MAG: glycosyl hydrolase, partial [Bacteroidetes bacterium]|nr:glycosyl hydrolase [Bacteroidota bacterium]